MLALECAFDDVSKVALYGHVGGPRLRFKRDSILLRQIICSDKSFAPTHHLLRQIICSDKSVVKFICKSLVLTFTIKRLGSTSQKRVPISLPAQTRTSTAQRHYTQVAQSRALSAPARRRRPFATKLCSGDC